MSAGGAAVPARPGAAGDRSDEWATIEAGVAQRVKALEAFLADVYASARVIADGVVPSQLITSSTHFHRAVWGIEPANGVRVHVAGVDLIRNPDGDVRVLEDNVRVPSGVSYVMTNRSAMITALPGAFANQRIRPVGGYPTRLLAALRKCAPSGRRRPDGGRAHPRGLQLGLLRAHPAGPHHGCRAGRGPGPGVPPRQGLHADHRGQQRVDVIYRRVDDDFLDPVHFRSDSMLGVPGLINAVRTGGVTLANAVGNGVADDKLIYTYVPDMIRYYLHAEPILRQRRHLAAGGGPGPRGGPRPAGRAGGQAGRRLGRQGHRHRSAGQQGGLDALRRRVTTDPRGWIAQPVVQLSTVPTLIEDQLAPRHVDLRPFAVNNGDDVWVLPGGLTRVALPEGELVVNSSQGGGSKDTWVLRPSPHRATGDAEGRTRRMRTTTTRTSGRRWRCRPGRRGRPSPRDARVAAPPDRAPAYARPEPVEAGAVLRPAHRLHPAHGRDAATGARPSGSRRSSNSRPTSRLSASC